jgi:hypothetical protein
VVIRISLVAAAVVAASAAQAQTGQPAAQAPQQISKADFTKNLGARFAAIDSNHDGSVTKEEIAAMQARTLADAKAQEQQQLAAEFAKLDTNHDKSLSQAEFNAAAPGMSVRQTPDQMLASIDSNKDGKISSAEFQAGPLADFTKADANHDGILSAQELAASRGR